MKTLILILATGACLASPAPEVNRPVKINEGKEYSNPTVPEDIYLDTASGNVPQIEKSDFSRSVALGPVGPAVEDKKMQVVQPIDLLPPEVSEGKPEGDLKTDASYWYGGGYRNWGYSSWGYPYYGRSFYRPRYYRPSFYSWYW